MGYWDKFFTERSKCPEVYYTGKIQEKKPWENFTLVVNTCLSFRHDFALLDNNEQINTINECKEWLRAFQNNKHLL